MFGPLGDLAAENPIIAICVGAAALVSASAVVKLINFLRVDGTVLKDTDLHGGDLVAKVFHEHGVKFVFTLVGGHISPLLVSSKKLGIQVIDVRHEVTSVFAADAVARLSGTVGVAAVTAGPGLTNTITAIKNAQMAESPVLLIGGAAGTLLKGRGALQDIDQMVLFKPLCKYTTSISRVRDIVPVLREAFRQAQSGIPGPVFVEMPIDTLFPYKTVMQEFGRTGESKSLKNRMVKWYLTHYVDKMFAGAHDPQDCSPLRVDIPLATPSQMDRAVALVRGAKRPLLLLGSQATLPPTPADKLRESVEQMGIPCYLGGMTRGLLGRGSPIQCTQQRRDALKEADVVILCGAVPDFRLDYGRSLSRKSRIIAINRDPIPLKKNTDLFWSPELAIQGDPGSFVAELASRLKDTGFAVSSEWLTTLRERDAKKIQANAKKTLEPAGKHMNPLALLTRFEATLSDNSILVADGGDFVGSAAYIVRPRGPLCWLDPGAFGTLGVGGGFALGAKLVRPDADVWILWGDGSCGYSVAEYDTYTRFKLPVLSLVGNDACWTQIAREQIPRFNSDVACMLDYSDYHVVADGYGGKGFVVDNVDNVDEVLREAVEFSRNGSGRPVMVNALIGKTNFREGSISV